MFRKILLLVLIILLGYFLYLRYKLGLVRYFDVDEFAHLHWGYSLFVGEVPYRDFFYIFPPFFLYPMAVIISIFGRTITSIISARVFIFVIFCLTTLVLILIGKKMRNLETGLIAGLIFTILPIPSDKMLEIRPDLIALLLSLVGLYTFIRGNFFLSGLAFAFGLGFVPKTVFYLVPVFFTIGGVMASLRSACHPRGVLRPFILGVLIPASLLFILLVYYGNPQFAFFNMTRVANSITATLGRRFYMRPDIFFYPNDTYYGIPGYSQPYWLNLAIYIIASVWAIHRFLSFKNINEFLIGGVFFANLYAFVYVFPLKHAQYLMIIAPFIAYYFADFITHLRGVKVSRGPLARARSPLIILLLFYLSSVGFQMYKQKLKWVNTDYLTKLSGYLSKIPPKTPIFDLTGETVFYPNGYYFCCLPYGQYEDSLLFNLPDIELEFKKRKTQIIHLGWDERLGVLPSYQRKFIEENFKPSEIDTNIWTRK